MAKLIVLALAFTALVAFASAHNSTIAEEGSSVSVSKQQCSQQFQGQRFNQCLSYTISTKENKVCCTPDDFPVCFICDDDQQGQGLGLEQCCNELKKVEEECQCEAMQGVYRKAQKQQQQWSQQQQGGKPQPKTQDLQQIVQNLRNQCKLQVKQCRIPTPMF